MHTCMRAHMVIVKQYRDGPQGRWEEKSKDSELLACTQPSRFVKISWHLEMLAVCCLGDLLVLIRWQFLSATAATAATDVLVIHKRKIKAEPMHGKQHCVLSFHFHFYSSHYASALLFPLFTNSPDLRPNRQCSQFQNGNISPTQSMVTCTCSFLIYLFHKQHALGLSIKDLLGPIHGRKVSCTFNFKAHRINANRKKTETEDKIQTTSVLWKPWDGGRGAGETLPWQNQEDYRLAAAYMDCHTIGSDIVYFYRGEQSSGTAWFMLHVPGILYFYATAVVPT